MFTFGLIPLKKVWTPFPLQLWVKSMVPKPFWTNFGISKILIPPTEIFNSYIFKILQQFTLRKLKRPLTAATGVKNQRHVISVKTRHILQLYILQLENWNKTNALVNVPKRETHHESDDLNRINSREFVCLPRFALLVTHKEKTSVSHAGQFEKDRIRASRCSGRKLLPHLPPAKRPEREAKFNLKNYTGWNANSYIYQAINLVSKQAPSKYYYAPHWKLLG